MKKPLLNYTQIIIPILLLFLWVNGIYPLPIKAEPDGVALPEFFYMRLEGAIDNKYEICMHLHREQDALYGYYYYLNIGIPLSVKGNIDQSTNFNLTEYTPEGIQSGAFSGDFVSENHIQGIWTSDDKQRRFNFSLYESYPENSIRFTSAFLEDECPLLEDRDSPKAEIKLQYYYPLYFKDPVVLKHIQNLILPQEGSTPLQKLEIIRDQYFANYIEINKGYYEADFEYAYMWQSINKMNIMLNDKKLLCYNISNYEYSGGAHGNYWDNFFIIDLDTGKVLSYSDIFIPGYEQELSIILNIRLREREDIGQDQSLIDQGYFVDFITPSAEFYVTLNGIGFFYNNYEIRPYAFGPVDLFIPFNQIKHLIKRDSGIRRLF